MSRGSIGLSDRLNAYVRDMVPEPAPLARLRAATAELPGAEMQIAPEQGALMALLGRLIDARRLLEIGTYTGYSSLAMALALPEARLVCLDVSDDHTAHARRAWADAGVADRIELRLAPALDSLAALEAEGGAPFDLAFIDADKTNYAAYYEACLRLVRPGGLILIDNVLWSGAVADPDDQSPDAAALRALNAALARDPRVDLSLTPIGDGLTILRRR